MRIDYTMEYFESGTDTFEADEECSRCSDGYLCRGRGGCKAPAIRTCVRKADFTKMRFESLVSPKTLTISAGNRWGANYKEVRWRNLFAWIFVPCFVMFTTPSTNGSFEATRARPFKESSPAVNIYFYMDTTVLKYERFEEAASRKRRLPHEEAVL